MKDESLRCKDINLVLRAILEQVTWDFADVADDKRFRSIRFRNKKDNRLNIIDYQSHHWQWSNMFVRYDSDFDDDSATFAA